MRGGESRLATAKPALELFLRRAAGAEAAQAIEVRPLSGGAIQENWLLIVDFVGGDWDGRQELVLRTDAPTAVGASLPRAHEFAVQRAAWNAGVSVPEPLWLCEDPAILGQAFYVMRRVAGEALGHRVVADTHLGGDRSVLAETLGRELARFHTIKPPQSDLSFLALPEPDAARNAVTTCRAYLDALGAPQPGLEWGLRWCEQHAPQPGEIVLVHQDFRTGNYMVDDTGLTAILDWEFCAWGDPMSDLGWFCAKCWRYSRADLEAGGIATREPFYRGYEAESSRRIDPDRVAYWELLAHIRWAVIALQQGRRTAVGGEVSLELGLTGRLYPPELELTVLDGTPPEKWADI
ncbi:MAG: phosphotransferase family protein [Alphaproteobacteria bacterium]